jgi:hypothetical protein
MLFDLVEDKLGDRCDVQVGNWESAQLQEDVVRAVTPAPATFAPARPVASPAPATPSYHSANTPRNFHYCWSHGLGRNSQHTSPTCTYPKEGHQTDATLDNMMEGCRLIARPPRHPRATGTDQV